MSVFSPVTWQMGSVQLVSTTTSQLATLNSIQAAFVASTYWEVETSGLSSLSYKYIVVRPKAALGSIYADFRIFFCERVNFATNRTVIDGTVAFNTATSVMAYFCPDGGALTFTAANIETGDIWPGTNYKNAAGTSTVWHTVAVACTALWLYEGNGVMWLVSRQTATSHAVLGLGNVVNMSNSTRVDYNAASVEIGLPSFISVKALNSSIGASTNYFTNAVTRSQGWWTKTSGVVARVFRTPYTTLTWSGNASSGWNSSAVVYDATSGTAAFIPATMYGVGGDTSFVSLRGVYYVSHMKTRTTIQTAGSTIGYTFFPDDALASYCLAFMNS